MNKKILLYTVWILLIITLLVCTGIEIFITKKFLDEKKANPKTPLSAISVLTPSPTVSSSVALLTSTSASSSLWKTYTNPTYGFTFQAPASYEVQELLNPYPSSNMEGACSVVYEIKLTDPTFKKAVYDCCYTPEEVETYGEKPSVTLWVQHADCSMSPDTMSLDQKRIEVELRQTHVPPDKAWVMSSLIPVGGQDVLSSTDTPQYMDSCEKNSVYTTSHETAVISSHCSFGPPVVSSTIAIFIPQSTTIVTVRDEVSAYTSGGIFDAIVRSFRFIEK